MNKLRDFGGISMQMRVSRLVNPRKAAVDVSGGVAGVVVTEASLIFAVSIINKSCRIGIR